MAGESGGSFGTALQVVGMFSSALGAWESAKSTKMVLSAQAQLDQINARSSAMAMNGQADLDLMNQKAGFESMSFGASMNMLTTEKNIFDAKSGASLNMLGATTAAAQSVLQANTKAAMGMIQAGVQSDTLAAGAQIDQQNAGLLELQAQSSMLHGEWREQDSRMQYAQVKSRATVQMARGNLDLSEGTPLMQRVSIDVMSERAATMIQQETLMQAFGQRQQASNLTLSSTTKSAQAQGLLTVAKAQSQADVQLGDLQSKAIIQQATLKSALTDMGAEFDLHMAQAQSDWMAAMMHAGMLEADAAAAYKHTMADVLVKNASAAAGVKQAMAEGISPNMSFLSSVLGNAGQVAQSWYGQNKVGG